MSSTHDKSRYDDPIAATCTALWAVCISGAQRSLPFPLSTYFDFFVAMASFAAVCVRVIDRREHQRAADMRRICSASQIATRVDDLPQVENEAAIGILAIRKGGGRRRPTLIDLL